MTAPCDCFIARHPRAAEIDAALLAPGADPRDVAARFGVGKSRVYEHRQHLRDGGAVAPREGVKGAPPSPPVTEPVKRPPSPPVERSMESVEPRMESRGTNVAQNVHSEPVLSARALPSEGPQGGAYAAAVQTIIGLKVNGSWRATHVEAIAAKMGLARSSVRTAHAEAVRHLQMGMGDYLARQATSALWVTKARDAAEDQALVAKKNAERWRRQEREAQDMADRLEGKERFAALDQAARFGMLATKYDLSAEKWSAQALAHQRHLDDVLCLRSPKELTQINLGGGEDVARFAVALARRFADRPEVLAELDAAAADIERGQEGDAGAIVVTGEAA